MFLSFINRPAALTSLLIASASISHYATAQTTYPQAIQSLVEQGITINTDFSGPSGLHVYAASYHGQDIALYLTSDKKHVMIGQLFDEQANNLTEQELDDHIINPRNQLSWGKIEKASWIQDGNKDAPVVLYAFMDPQCPYCHKFREQAEPWVKAGKVQIRHIVVGILGQSSFEKAATINGSSNKTAAFLNNQNKFDQGGIKPNSRDQMQGQSITNTNNMLMREVGVTGAPAIFFKRDGKVQLMRGLPQGEGFSYMMGD